MDTIRIEVIPGAGGVDADDWAKMLLQMYFHFGRRVTLTSVDHHFTENPIDVEFKCPEFYTEYLLAESGVHRLIRVSPFDQEHRRQTAFAEVIVNGQKYDGRKYNERLHQIRTYTLDPYQLVHNHYNGVEDKNVQYVFNGHIELMWRAPKQTDPPSDGELEWLKSRPRVVPHIIRPTGEIPIIPLDSD